LDAMRKAKTLKPGLVVLDLMLPKLDGSHVLKFLQSQDDLKAIRVIVFPDAGNADIGKAALAENPDAAFLKSHGTAPPAGWPTRSANC